jgi:hypothetical protein
MNHQVPALHDYLQHMNHQVLGCIFLLKRIFRLGKEWLHLQIAKSTALTQQTRHAYSYDFPITSAASRNS